MYAGPRPPYVPYAASRRRAHRRGYPRPIGPRPGGVAVVPVGAGAGGAGILAAILGPIGGLTGCLCCLNTIGIWGLFITAIPLTVFINKKFLNYQSLVNEFILQAILVILHMFHLQRYRHQQIAAIIFKCLSTIILSPI
ncbi:unnamed protein product [Rotaria sordida]|uniref:Uncharacterized protein n=1 Tax=Rotaria sordida TaxID=392033 RepID=A0A818SBQ3_9BILA|nr:unnamed protein product [Rotaria sordida]CAF3873840.1 unnamed protein product [Rotaria sordida]